MYRRKTLPVHPNGMRFTATDAVGAELDSAVYHSVGGGSIVDDTTAGTDRIAPDETTVPYPFDSGGQLLEHAAAAYLSISEPMLANERSWRDDDAIHKELANIWGVMAECVHNG